MVDIDRYCQWCGKPRPEQPCADVPQCAQLSRGTIFADGPVHSWFGLTYGAYMVLPRTILQSMPLKWQEEFIALIKQADAVHDDVARALRLGDVEGKVLYRISAHNRYGKFMTERLGRYRHVDRDTQEAINEAIAGVFNPKQDESNE